MSTTNTLFKPVASDNTQQTTFSNNVTINTTTKTTTNILNQQQQQQQQQQATKPATFDNVVSTQKNSLAAQKKNLRYVPPAFFAGGALKRKEFSFSASESEIRSGSFSLSNNERRFSGSLADLSDLNSKKNEVQNQTRIFSKPARPNHGLFGDGIVEKKRKIEKEYKLVKDGSKPVEPRASIEVTGYPLGSEKFIAQHFSQYGTIKHQITSNDRLIINFDNFYAAILAQKSDGFEHEGHKLSVKLQAEQITSESDGWDGPPTFIRLEKSDDLFKITSKHKLGDGTNGLSAFDKNTVPYGITLSNQDGMVTRAKDTFLGW